MAFLYPREAKFSRALSTDTPSRGSEGASRFMKDGRNSRSCRRHEAGSGIPDRGRAVDRLGLEEPADRITQTTAAYMALGEHGDGCDSSNDDQDER
jgi:hypothetical protein